MKLDAPKRKRLIIRINLYSGLTAQSLCMRSSFRVDKMREREREVTVCDRNYGQFERITSVVCLALLQGA